MSGCSNLYAIEGLIQNPRLRQLFEYWRAISPRCCFPEKKDFDAINVPLAVWPHMFMVDVLDEEPAFKFRLMGTYVVSALGSDFTGLRLCEEEIPGITGSKTFELMQQLRLTQRPQHYRGATQFGRAMGYAGHEQIVLPLIAKPNDISVAVGAIDYFGFGADLFQPG